MTENIDIKNGIRFNIYKTNLVQNFTELLDYIIDLIDIDKSISKQYKKDRAFIRTLIANLIVSNKAEQPILIARDKTKWATEKRYVKLFLDYYTMVRVTDLFVENGLMIQHIGFLDRTKGISKITRLVPTDYFNTLVETFCTKHISYFDKDTPDEVIILTDRVYKNGKKSSVRVLYTETRAIEKKRNRLVKYNKFINEFKVEVKADDIKLSNKAIENLSKLMIGGMLKLNIERNLNNNQNCNFPQINSDSENKDRRNNNNIEYRKSIIESNSDIESNSYMEYSSNRNISNTTTTNITHPLSSYNLSMELIYLHLHSVNNRRKFTLGGRFYGAVYQSISSELRPYILIDNEPTVELDYASLHIRMLYHQKGIDYREDPYTAIADSKEDRKYLKLVMLVAINDKSEKSVPYSVISNTKKSIKAGKDIEVLSVEKIKEYLNRFKEHHKPIADCICADKGIKLQYLDSTIMGNIMNTCMRLNIPVLPVHDSVVAPAQYEAAVQNIMMEEYFKVMNFYPIVDKKGA